MLDEGISRNMLEAAKPIVAQVMTAANRRTAADRAALPRVRAQAQAAAVGAPARTAADAHFAFGQYAEAAELYRLALQKGGEDANLVNLRLGAALALAGRRPEAEAALRATTGPRADLAGFGSPGSHGDQADLFEGQETISMKMLMASLAAAALLGGPAALTTAASAQYGPVGAAVGADHDAARPAGAGPRAAGAADAAL